MVHIDQKTIKDAANRLKINYSTAKHIVKSHKDMKSLHQQMVPSQNDARPNTVLSTTQTETQPVLLGKRPAPVPLSEVEREARESNLPKDSEGEH